MKSESIVVTGLGVVSSIGVGWRAYWESLLAGRSGIRPIQYIDTSDYPTHFGGEVRDFDPKKFISPGLHEKFGRGAQFAIAAAQMALEDAGLMSFSYSRQRIGVCIGTTMADIEEVESLNEQLIYGRQSEMRPASFIKYPGCSMSTSIGAYFDLRGPNFMIPTACAAGNYAIGYACDLLRLNKADVVLAGGAEPFSRTVFEGFNRIFAVAPDCCRPFDRNRKGMIPGEGAGIIVLERYPDAIARNAPLYAEILGYGTSCDAEHMTIPSVDGVAAVMIHALRDADVDPADVDYINAHGTGTPMNDKTECAAIKRVFGSRADTLPISSTKSMLGHAMGSASALETIGCILSVKYDHITPTINYENRDPECDIDCVPNQSRRQAVNIAVKNAFAFGGNNASLVIGKIKS